MSDLGGQRKEFLRPDHGVRRKWQTPRVIISDLKSETNAKVLVNYESLTPQGSLGVS